MAGPAPAGPSTSAEVPPAHPALKPTAITPAVYARMAVDFKMRRNDDIRQNCAEHVDRILDRLELATDTLLRPDRDNPGLKLPTDDEVIADMAQQFLCLQHTAFVHRNVAAHEARTAFQVVNKLKPPEIKVKKVKTGRKEKKENVASAKVDRTPKEKATPVVPKTPQRQSVDENNDTPVAINKGKRRAAAVAVAAVSANSVAEKAAEKVEKSEKRTRKDAVKKRTSNRLSKTPRVNTKEEEEPTYCFCSRVSFGEMIGCDNDKCEIEWFHFECIGLTTKPKGKWFCPNCRHPDSARMPKTAKSAKKEKD